MTQAQPATPPIDSGHVIRAVSESLRRLIRSEVSELRAESAVVFESPAEIDSQGENKLSLYLYQMAVNPYLRNLPGTLTRQAGRGPGPVSLRAVPPPLVVNLVYIMVPYAKSAELELVLADKLAGLFHDVGALAGPLLDPVLRATGNTTLSIVPEPMTMDSVRNLWAAFPGKPYKLTQVYLVSPVRIPAGRDASADMTTDATLQAREVRHG